MMMVLAALSSWSKRWEKSRVYGCMQAGEDVDIEKSVLGVEVCVRDCLVLGHTVTWEEEVGGEGV